MRLPRIVVAAPTSNAGKTSVATGLIAALTARGLTVSPHKVGPDYIDPGYHGLAAGRPGRNLDAVLVGEERIVPLLLHGARIPTVADVAVVEGVMGLFDGAAHPDLEPGFASTAHVARLTRSPVVLVVDASSQAQSVAALVHGFATFDIEPYTLGGITILKGPSALLNGGTGRVGGTINLIPKRAICEPDLTLGLPPAATAANTSISRARSAPDACIFAFMSKILGLKTPYRRSSASSICASDH